MRLAGLPSASIALAIGIGISFVALLAVQLRDRLRWSPWVVGLILGAVVVAGVVLAGTRSTAPLLWAVRDGGPAMVGLLVAGGLGFAALLRLCRMSWINALLIAEAMTLIAAVSWVPREGWIDWQSPNLVRLDACFTTARTWRTYGLSGLLYDALPNVVLYIPLGMALAATMRRHRWVALLVGLAVTMATESYQALFTDRTCAGNDVLTNLAGTAVGIGLVVGMEAVAGRRRRPRVSRRST
ncbi:MAG: VanZ family protein [Dermatophilaceae bacterium]